MALRGSQKPQKAPQRQKEYNYTPKTKNAYLGLYDDFRANTIFRLYFNSQKEYYLPVFAFLKFLCSALFLKSSEMPEKRPRLNENNKRSITIPLSPKNAEN